MLLGACNPGYNIYLQVCRRSATMAARRPNKTAAAQRTKDLEPSTAKTALRNNLSNHALYPVIQDRVFMRVTFIRQEAFALMNVFFRHWHQICTAPQAPIPAPLRPFQPQS